MLGDATDKREGERQIKRGRDSIWNKEREREIEKVSSKEKDNRHS